MTETLINCPACGHRFAVSEALGAQLRAELEVRLRAEHEAHLQRAVAQAEARTQQFLDLELKDLQAQLADKARSAEAAQNEQLALRQRARELEEQNRDIAARVRAEVEEAARKEAEARIKAAAAQAEAHAREHSGKELALLQEQLAEQQQKVQAAQEAELSLRKEKLALEERARELDLEIARRLDAEKQRLEESIRKSVGEEQSLKLREKEKQIDDLRKALEDAKRMSEQGSQELQGEVLELDVEAALVRQFPQDTIRAVPKGTRGADLIQEVRNGFLQTCGTILWETKNTKHWSPAWVAKLKEDQRAVGASVAVLVSVALPEEIAEFGQIDGVWVASLRAWPALAIALREQIIQVAFAHAASEGKNEKMELLYRYLAGAQFRQRVQGIVEAFTALQTQLLRERRAMEKLWKEREKQIECVITNTVGMYGEMRGIVGASLPEIPALELDPDAEPLLEDQREEQAP